MRHVSVVPELTVGSLPAALPLWTALGYELAFAFGEDDLVEQSWVGGIDRGENPQRLIGAQHVHEVAHDRHGVSRRPLRPTDPRGIVGVTEVVDAESVQIGGEDQVTGDRHVARHGMGDVHVLDPEILLVIEALGRGVVGPDQDQDSQHSVPDGA